MTLFKQLLIMIIVLVVFSFFGTFYFTQHYTREYLDQQLQTHAQDAATSLGLSLSSAMQHKDTPLMESMVDAIFDRGYYSEITLRDVKGKVLVKRQQKVQINHVPEWFVDLFSFTVPQEYASVMSGWHHAGRVMVRSHPGFAYQELWHTLLALSWWYLALIIMAAVAGFFTLRWLFQPLKTITEQAQAICKQEFGVVSDLPGTVELRRVSHAMNTMSMKLKSLFERQTQLADYLRQQAYQDPITGLANRRAFDSQLGHLVTSPDDFRHGFLIMLGLDDLQKYNEKCGYAGGDRLLQKIATHLLEIFTPNTTLIIAHLSGGYFAILVSEFQQSVVDKLIDDTLRAVEEDYKLSNIESVVHIGAVSFLPGLTAEKFLSAADMALREAQAALPFTAKMFQHKPDEVKMIRTANQWHEVLKYIIKEKTILLYQQDCHTVEDNKIHHREILLRAKDEENNILTAAQLMPLAERFDLATELDKQVVEEILAYSEKHPNPSFKYAINLSLAAMTSSRFVNWLVKVLSNHPEAAKAIVFEIFESAVTRFLPAFKMLVQRVTEQGAQVAIDQFGREYSAFAYLSGLELAYLKLDGSYTQNIHFNQDSQFYINSISQIARTLDIPVIATRIENEEQWKALNGLGIDGAQGDYIGEVIVLS